MIRTHLAATIGLLGCLAPIASQAQQAPPSTLRYGQIAASARSISSLPLYVAQRQGFLTRHGIELDVVPIQGGTHFMLEALDKGTVDVTYTATPYLVKAALAGSDAVAIAGASGNNLYTLIAKPGISSIAGLKDKTVGLSLPVDTITISTRRLLTKHGLVESAYRSVELVGTPARTKCLTEGECAAVPLTQPEDFALIAKGYRRLGDSSEVVPELQFSVLAVKRSWGAANKDVTVRLLRAFGDAFAFMADPKNRTETAAIISATTSATPEIARQLLSYYYEPDKGVFPRRGEINLKGFTQVITFMAEAKELSAPLPDAHRFIDLQHLQAAGLQ